jgi:hypothetical protein
MGRFKYLHRRYLEQNINSRASDHIVNAGMAALETEEYLEGQTDIAMGKYVTGENYVHISDKITALIQVIKFLVGHYSWAEDSLFAALINYQPVKDFLAIEHIASA